MKLSSRKQLLSEADAELKRIKDFVIEQKKQINEFDITGEIHTTLQVYLDGLETEFVRYYVPSSSIIEIKKKILEVIGKIAKKYNGKIIDQSLPSSNYSKISPSTHFTHGLRPLIIEWERQMDQSEFDKIYNELKTEAEKVFNTKLFQFHVNGFLFKSTGILGTPITKGKITKWFTDEYEPDENTLGGSSFGEGDKYQKEYLKFLRNLKSTRSEFFNEKIRGKVKNLLYKYFTDNPGAIFKKTDWLKDISSQTEKLFDTFKVDEPTAVRLEPIQIRRTYSPLDLDSM